MAKNWLIVGACSGIATELCRELARRKARLFLCDIDEERLALLASDLRARHKVEVQTARFDVLDFNAHERFVTDVEESLGPLYGVAWVAGIMGDQEAQQSDFTSARKVLDVNYTAALSMLNIIAARMETRGQGHIVGFSSPAGDRGRASNYIYGAAKGALAILLSGLRQRLDRSGVSVLTVKPGFVDTKMTKGMNLPFAADPKDVARDVANAIDKKRNVVYTPWFWEIIMGGIIHLPEMLFKKLKF